MLFAVPLEIILSITRRHHCQYEVEKEPSRCNVEEFLYQHNEKRQSNESQKEYLVVAFK